MAGLIGAGMIVFVNREKDDSKALKADRVGVLESRFEKLENENGALKDELAALKGSTQGLRSDIRSLAESMNAAKAEMAKTAAALLAKSEQPVGVRAQEPSEGSAAPQAKKSAQDWLTELRAAKSDRSRFDAMWKDIRAAGMLAEVIAAYETASKDDPSNPDLKVDLGNAYLQKTFEAGGGPEAGVWATKADKVFDQALALNPEHWEARFTKAVSLSFWPPALGKQAEAIKNFETLVEQQERGSQQSYHSETYIFLGNLYQQSGKGDKAVETWKRGYSRFPDSSELKKQIDLASGGR